MNIFVLDVDAKNAARYLCDKHVIKMIVESAQLLSTAHRVVDGERRVTLNAAYQMITVYDHPIPEMENVLYKAYSVYHPCCKWVRSSFGNYSWLYAHFVALCIEYHHRYGKIHLTERKLITALKDPPEEIRISSIEAFNVVAGGRPRYQVPPHEAVELYREYYKKKFDDGMEMVWTNRAHPEWVRDWGRSVESD
ncbi:hypothetical protein LCGC14_1040300 [marine sediment metagenome]|uniref:Uncharacterized protein n=1 Tax=marine sediment metagenome TaxID=412755 RepID=A0A0F9QA54_9ZZZZ